MASGLPQELAGEAGHVGGATLLVVRPHHHQVGRLPHQHLLRRLPDRSFFYAALLRTVLGRDAHNVLELLPEVFVEPTVEHGVRAGGGHPHHVTHGVDDPRGVLGEVLRFSRVGYEVEQVEGQPADAEDDGD